MASRVDEWRGTTTTLAERLRPRDDLIVREVPAGSDTDGDTECDTSCDPARSGSASFGAVEGPFLRYERRVEWEPDGSELRITQRIDWRLGIPYWAWLYRPFVHRALRDGVAGHRPWWLFPDRISVPQARAVSTMALFSLVSGLLYGQLTQVLTFASADIGDGSSGQQAAIFAFVRIGTVLTAFMMFQADRFGRRRIALWSFGLAIATSVATAFVPSLAALSVLQAVSRNLAVAGLLAIDTLCIEELPAGSRAMASGLGAMAYGLGSGVVVVSLPLADVSPWGWRLVFALSLITVPLVWSGARTSTESHRFLRLHPDRSGPPSGTGDPPPESRRIHGSRFVLLAALFVLLNLLVAPMSQLQNDYLRSERGFDGFTIAVFTVLTGTPAALGVIVGGRIADTRGRRWALVPGLVALAVFIALFFNLSGAPMWVSSLVAAVLGTLTVAPLGVLAPELFPTARRGGARGALNVLAVTGSVLGLLLAGAGVDAAGYGPTFALLALGPLIAAGLAFAVPETGGRELEEINQEA